MIRHLGKVCYKIADHTNRTLMANAISKGHNFEVKYPYLNNYSVNIEHPFETFMSAIAACQTELIRAHSRSQGFKLGLIHWKNISSNSIKLDHLEDDFDPEDDMPLNEISQINLQTDIETNLTQEELQKLKAKIEKLCPISQMMLKRKVEIISSWNAKTV